MALYLGEQRVKIALNGVLCHLSYGITSTAINLLTKDGHILLDSDGVILKVNDFDNIIEGFNILTTSDGLTLMDSQGQLLSISDSIVSNNILLSSDDYILLDIDNKKLVIQGA